MTNSKSARIQKLVEVSKSYKIDGYGFGNPMPQRLEVAHRVNANLMDFAFSFLGNKERYFDKYSEMGVTQ
jgi:hypothetical protein